MMDRVGTLGFSQTLLAEYSRIQARSTQTQIQISTGKVGDQYKDVKDDASVLAAAKSKAAQVDVYIESIKAVAGRIDFYDVQLQEMSDLAGRLRESTGNALSTGHAPAMMNELRSLYQSVVGILNTQVDGKYIYGGSRSDRPPVTAETLDELLAAPSVADVFQNSTLKQSDRLDDGEMLETGVLASELGSGILQIFKDIAAFDAGAGGPIGSDLTQAQITFLTGIHTAIPAVADGINTIAATNGANSTQAEAALTRHQDMAAYFVKFTSDIEDADLATALARLNQDQVAAEAAGRMIAGLNQMSLLNFIAPY